MADGVRQAEVVGALALASDASMGHAPDLTLGTAALAVALARTAGASPSDVRASYDVALMRFIGCTADSHLAADAFGDEIRMRGFMAPADFGSPTSVLSIVFQHSSALGFLRALGKMQGLFDSARAHCEVAERLAVRLGYPVTTTRMLSLAYERWDGKGVPNRTRGEAMLLPARIASLAHEVGVFFRIGGEEAARAMVEDRSGGAHDPSLCRTFLDASAELCAALSAPSPWAAMLEAEPRPIVRYDEAALDRALEVIADFSDLKCRWTPGHSSAVASLAHRAALELGLSERDATLVRRAALVHDVGRSGVSASIWDKAGPLTDAEWEQVRLHGYHGERVFARSADLASIGELAARHHERMDGSGYHRGAPAAQLGVAARVLAAADAYQAMTEARPHRAALSPSAARAALEADLARGVFCPDAVRAVLAVAGHSVRRAAPDPTTLSERELEVLRLVVRGLSNKQMGKRLGISPKTVSRHVEHIYGKLRVSTRAGATLAAMERGLVPDAA